MMKTNFSTRLLAIFISVFLLIHPSGVSQVNAASFDIWWDEDWPYRVQLTVADSGPVSVNPDFTALFTQLGLPGALLDLDSIRIVPHTNGAPGEPVSFEETLSVLIMDGETLNLNPAGTDPYWTQGDQSTVSLDPERFSQGSNSIKAEIIIQENLSPQPDFIYCFENTSISDWSAYESMVYDVWPEVNAAAIDQTTDLYQIEFLGLQLCPKDRINGPSLVMDQWNRVATSLLPLGNCAAPDFSEMEGLRLFLTTQQPGGFDAGDRLTLWLDNLRLVDQDGDGEIRWIADEHVDSYYLYFDTLNHTGHPTPDQTTFSGDSFETGTIGAAEAGGYFNLVSGVTSTDLTIWSAPNIEKTFKTQLAPITESPIFIQAARGELEAFQIIVQSPTDRDLTIIASDLVGQNNTIPSHLVQVFRVDYVTLSQISDSYGRLVEWPDPLFPLLSGESIHFSGGENQPLWVRVEVPSNVSAGVYEGAILVGATEIPYSLEIWDFLLPDTAYIDFSAGFDWDAVLTAYGVSDPGTPAACVAQFESAIFESLDDYHLTPNPDLEGILVYTLTDYEVQEAQTSQSLTNLPVWWAFTGWDNPPFANPAVIDRTGLDARILPGLAWLDRVDGLYTTQVVDWDSNPWTTPFSNDLSNGDGFLFYPPNDSSLGYDPCDEISNRLIPSIRLELLREGLEDSAYLYLLNGRGPEIGVENEGDLHFQSVAFSRTAFNRDPTAIMDMRQSIAEMLADKQSQYYLPLMTR